MTSQQKNAENQEVYAVEVFDRAVTTSKHRVKYIMVPELTETCKNKLYGALIVPQYIVNKLYPFIYGDEYVSEDPYTNMIYDTITEYEYRLYRQMPQKTEHAYMNIPSLSYLQTVNRDLKYLFFLVDGNFVVSFIIICIRVLRDIEVVVNKSAQHQIAFSNNIFIPDN